MIMILFFVMQAEFILILNVNILSIKTSIFLNIAVQESEILDDLVIP